MFIVFLLLFAFDLAVLSLVLLLQLVGLNLVFLVLSLEAVLGGLVDLPPHVADDPGNFCYLGSRVVSLHTIIHFTPIQEKCGESTFRRRRLG